MQKLFLSVCRRPNGVRKTAVYDLGENPANQRSSQCKGLEIEARLTHLKRRKEAAVVEEDEGEGVDGR